MHRCVSMKTSIAYLHVRLKSRLAITQNELKTNPALLPAQIPISEPFLVSFESHVGRKILSKTKFWQPLNRDNVSDIIIGLQN